MFSKPEVKVQEKTERFFQLVEAGDIALLDIIEEALAVSGFTKVGKTSSCHILCGSPLRAQSQKGELTFRPCTNLFLSAKVGNTTNSETQIPNIFQAKIRQKNTVPAKFKTIKVIDQPGYGDTYGFHRMFSNGYFHYRTFSKTPKLKFVLAVNKHDLTGTGEYFKKTIFNFINSFSDWDAVKENIYRATSLLITKADPGTQLNNLRNILEDLREAVTDLKQKPKEKYQGMITEFLNSNRIFFIEKPTRVDQKTGENNILQQIYDSSQFWVRPIQGNVVDMKNINFSVSKEIMTKLRDPDQEVFREEYEAFMKHMNLRTDSMLVSHPSSLINIVKQLSVDAVNSSESRQFLSDMEVFNKEYYKFMEQYKERRQTTQVNLFKSIQGGQWVVNSNEELQKEMRSAYFIKKFKVLEYLQSLGKQFDTTIGRSIEELEDFSHLFINIFRKFSILQVSQKETGKIIYKYSYIIQRLIEESKILTLILFSSESVKHEMNTIMKTQIISQDIFRMVKDKLLALTFGEIDVSRLKQEFTKKLNFQDLLNVNDEVLNFFETIPEKGEEIEIKISRLIIQYSESLFKEDKKPSDQEKRFAAKKLLEYRNNFYAHMDREQSNGTLKREAKHQLTEIIVQLTNLLAHILQTFRMFGEARDCYRSVNNAHSVFQMYNMELQDASKEPFRQKTILIQYADQASQLSRRDLAIKCYQHAYSLSSSYIEMKQIADKIIELGTENKEKINELGGENKELKDFVYLSRFLQQKFCSEYSQELIRNIVILLGL